MKHTVVVSIQIGALVKPCMQQLVELSSFLYSPFVKPNVLLVSVKPKYCCLLYLVVLMSWTFKILQKCNQYFEGKSRKNRFFFLNFIASLMYSCNDCGVSVIIIVTILNVFVLLVAIHKKWFDRCWCFRFMIFCSWLRF